MFTNTGPHSGCCSAPSSLARRQGSSKHPPPPLQSSSASAPLHPSPGNGQSCGSLLGALRPHSQHTWKGDTEHTRDCEAWLWVWDSVLFSSSGTFRTHDVLDLLPLFTPAPALGPHTNILAFLEAWAHSHAPQGQAPNLFPDGNISTPICLPAEDLIKSCQKHSSKSIKNIDF